MQRFKVRGVESSRLLQFELRCNYKELSVSWRWIKCHSELQVMTVDKIHNPGFHELLAPL